MLSLAAKPTRSTRRPTTRRPSPEVPIMVVKIHSPITCNGTTGTDNHVRVDHDEMNALAQIFRAIVSGDRRCNHKIRLH
ncbi:hypothetical protein GN958_ATG20048 [Phytophthora infestans]|nr:hypothetical protein GN958_ATG20048 [Phytophthora infestans]